MKRKLNQDEKKFCELKLRDLEFEMENAQYQSEYLDLMLRKGLKINFAAKEKEFKIQKRDYEQQLLMMAETIKILKDQVRNGVEIKKVEEVKREEQ